jgi:hypothetical protein
VAVRFPRFTIAGLMLAVLAVAVGFAALRNATPAWAGAMLLLTLGLLGLAVLGVVYRRGARRAWWLGFALFGGGYVLLTFAPWADEHVRPTLPTAMLIDALHERLHPREPTVTDAAVLAYLEAVRSAPTSVVVPGGTTPGGTTASAISFLSAGTGASATPEPFRRVGHCLWALLAACVGGAAGRLFYATGGSPDGSRGGRDDRIRDDPG